MKKETVVKRMKGYVKSLSILEKECISAGDTVGQECYQFDIAVFKEAINIMERSNT